MNCPKCNATIPAGKNFCVECGEHLPEQTQVRKCAKCGAAIPNGKNFCVECGEHLPEQTQVRKCAKCGAAIPNGKNFCVECGEHLPEQTPVRKCAKCGTAIPNGKNFCVECGEFLTSSTTAPQNTIPAGKLNFWQKIFQRRLARKDYWLLVVFQLILLGILQMIGVGIISAGAVIAGIIFEGVLELIFFFLFLFLDIERLHDADKSGWNICWLFLPIIGYVIILIQLCLPGTNGNNRFGNPPQRIF